MRSSLASLLIMGIFLSGCSGMPISTMIKLGGLDPMEADPAQVRVDLNPLEISDLEDVTLASLPEC